MYSVKVNDADKLNKIDPEPDNSATERKLDLERRSTQLCPRFKRRLVKNSIFSVPEKRKQALASL